LKLVVKTIILEIGNIPKREPELFIDRFYDLLYNVIAIINLFNALSPPCK